MPLHWVAYWLPDEWQAATRAQTGVPGVDVPLGVSICGYWGGVYDIMPLRTPKAASLTAVDWDLAKYDASFDWNYLVELHGRVPAPGGVRNLHLLPAEIWTEVWAACLAAVEGLA